MQQARIIGIKQKLCTLHSLLSSERLMHTKREKHNKKLWSYRLTFTPQNLLLLLRKRLKGRNRS